MPGPFFVCFIKKHKNNRSIFKGDPPSGHFKHALVLKYMENRITRFYELHNNKWFHIMNLSLEIIKTDGVKQKQMLMEYGLCFFYIMAE